MNWCAAMDTLGNYRCLSGFHVFVPLLLPRTLTELSLFPQSTANLHPRVMGVDVVCHDLRTLLI